MSTVLFSAPYMIPSRDRFQPVFDHFGIELIEPVVHERLSENELLTYAGQFEGAVCGDDCFTEQVLMKCFPRLKVISKWGTGIDSIDKEAAARLGIQVRNTPNAFTLPVADTVMGYILSFARNIPWMDRDIRNGVWDKVQGRSVSECTLGVIGLGNIGKAVIRRARAFGMKIYGNDIIPIAPDFLAEYRVEMTDLQDLLARADFVTVNCDLNPTSVHLIDEQRIAWMKPGAVLINTARGPIVKQKALIPALETGKIGGAALDVFEDEPLTKDSPFCKIDRVLLAPHNANSSPTAWERVHWNTLRNLIDGLGMQADDVAQFSGVL